MLFIFCDFMSSADFFSELKFGSTVAQWYSALLETKGLQVQASTVVSVLCP